MLFRPRAPSCCGGRADFPDRSREDLAADIVALREVWKAGTLEWLVNDTYAARSVPWV